ncbi:hypothetical protein [Corynebacterium renale]|uniref:hypothetical protein n=1 Tax=Corynebacterium renale TaxID=1724 RepID=UPI00155901E1|nr:hypothetical protein [Corynebacterium renale]
MSNASNNSVFLGYPEVTPAKKQVDAGVEVAPDFPREWIEFPDPEDPQRVYSIDITWLESYWNCAFGTPECQGINFAQPDVGCCGHGAFLSDDSDRENLYQSVQKMPAKYWQLRPEGPLDDDMTWLEWDELENEDGDMEPALKTKVVDGGCIFANRAGWATGHGCALHQWAMDEGIKITVAKPEVCWQVPLSREDEWEVRGDGEDILRTTIGQYDRRQWGDGGLWFDWWCTDAPACHTATKPLWQTMETELRTLMGDAAYDVLADLLRRRAERGGGATVHPASVESRRAN